MNKMIIKNVNKTRSKFMPGIEHVSDENRNKLTVNLLPYIWKINYKGLQ